jgi:hypothetical protein
MYGTAAATGRPTACGRKSVNCRDLNANASCFDPKNVRRHRVLVQCLDTQNCVGRSPRKRRSIALRNPGCFWMRHSWARRAVSRRSGVSACSTRRRSLVAYSRASVRMSDMAGSRPVGAAAIPPPFHSSALPPGHRQGAPRPSKACCEKKLPLWRKLRGRVKPSRLAILRNST